MSRTSGAACKISFQSQIHKITKLPADFDSLKETVLNFYETQLPEKWVVQYTDSDGDPIIVSNDEDYNILREEECSSSASSVRLFVVPMSQLLTGREEMNERSQSMVQQGGTDKEESPQKRSIASPENGKLKDKQRRFALKLIQNLKRHDISKAKREKMETQLKELNVKVPSPKKDRQEDDTMEDDQGNRASLSQQNFSTQTSYGTQSSVLFNRKKEGNAKKAFLKKQMKTNFLSDDILSEDDEEEEEHEVEKVPKKEILQPQEKAMKLKEMFTDANLENLISFANEFPYLELDELIENYLRFL